MKVSTGLQRVIFECRDGNHILACRAANWLRSRPQNKDAIVAYGEGASEVTFYVKKNKSSISVRELES